MKYSSGIALLVVDLLVLVYFFVEVFRARQLGVTAISTEVLVRSMIEGYNFGSWMVYVLFLMLPMVATYVLNFLHYLLTRSGGRHMHVSTSRFKSAVLVTHAMASLFLSLLISILPSLEQWSGICGSGPCFEALYGTLGLTGPTVLGGIFTLFMLPGLVTVVSGLILKDRDKRDEIIEDWRDWISFSDESGDFHPSQPASLIYLNNASMAPSIRAIEERARRYKRRYKFLVPTSREARDLLLEKSRDLRGLIKKHILGVGGSNFRVDFFTGTSRALEVGLCGLENVEILIVSPFEHPSQTDVIRWFAKVKGDIRVVQIEDTAEGLEDSRSTIEQVDYLISKVSNFLDAIGGDQLACLLISEVAYRTGQIIPVKDVIDRLREKNHNLIFFVDGSQAVGNIECPFQKFSGALGMHDRYYFSAHKWLLSPSTCGVLVTHVNNKKDNEPIKAYDMFGDALPTSTIDPDTIFDTVSALELLFVKKFFLKLRSRSLMAKAAFLEYCQDRNGKLAAVQVGNSRTKDDESLFIAVKPRSGFRWGVSLERFWKSIRDGGIDVTVNQLGEAERSRAYGYWLRVSFSHIITHREMRRFIRQISRHVTEAS